jgi:5-methylcytosine-specific restriction endonuclease McrA
MSKYGSNKEKLFKKQKGICPLCLKEIDFESSYSNDLHIDHIIPISKKGPKGLISNMRLVHKLCHKLHHRAEV